MSDTNTEADKKLGSVLDMKTDGLVREQDFPGLRIETVDLSGGSMHEVDLCGMQMTECKIDGDTKFDGISIKAALKAFRKQAPI